MTNIFIFFCRFWYRGLNPSVLNDIVLFFFFYLFRVTSAAEADFCRLLQQAIINAIEGSLAPEYDTRFSTYPKNNRYVAMFGDSDIRRTGDWVEILYPNRPPPPQVCFVHKQQEIVHVSVDYFF